MVYYNKLAMSMIINNVSQNYQKSILLSFPYISVDYPSH